MQLNVYNIYIYLYFIHLCLSGYCVCDPIAKDISLKNCHCPFLSNGRKCLFQPFNPPESKAPSLRHV